MRTSSQAARAHSAIDAMSDRGLPLIDRLSKRSHSLVERTAIGASDAADAILRGRNKLSIVRGAAIGRTRGFVRDHPLSTVAIAVIAGAVVRGLWRTRRD